MKILILSDLHLDDRRNSAEFECRRLEQLARFIAAERPAAVLNLGDTVSRAEFLRPGAAGAEEAFRRYRRWRDALEVPFRECAVVRELPFFERVMTQHADSVWTELPDMAVVTLVPLEASEHRLTREQLEWLRTQLHLITAPSVLIGTHVPMPGSCSRREIPGTFLEFPPELRELLAGCGKRIFWAGGHFHWDAEPPGTRHNVTAFCGGRFRFEFGAGTPTFLRTIDAGSGEIQTLFPQF